MSQLSRPYQIALAAIVLLAVVWFVALRGHSVSPSSNATLPGVKGLSTDINAAHNAVRTSKSNASSLQAKSVAASSSSVHAASTSVVSSSGSPSAPSSPTPAASASSRAAGTPSDAGAPLLSDVQHGKVAVLLFWNPRSSDDQAVERAVQHLSRRDGRVVVTDALVSQVADYGSITRGVTVTQSPTVLVINSRDQATAITGLQDTRDIQQAVGDAIRAAEAA